MIAISLKHDPRLNIEIRCILLEQNEIDKYAIIRN